MHTTTHLLSKYIRNYEIITNREKETERVDIGLHDSNNKIYIHSTAAAPPQSHIHIYILIYRSNTHIAANTFKHFQSLTSQHTKNTHTQSPSN